jgi:hypothetical protein
MEITIMLCRRSHLADIRQTHATGFRGKRRFAWKPVDATFIAGQD